MRHASDVGVGRPSTARRAAVPRRPTILRTRTTRPRLRLEGQVANDLNHQALIGEKRQLHDNVVEDHPAKSRDTATAVDVDAGDILGSKAPTQAPDDAGAKRVAGAIDRRQSGPGGCFGVWSTRRVNKPHRTGDASDAGEGSRDQLIAALQKKWDRMGCILPSGDPPCNNFSIMFLP